MQNFSRIDELSRSRDEYSARNVFENKEFRGMILPDQKDAINNSRLEESPEMQKEKNEFRKNF